MLLSLLQNPVADPESEAVARKVSYKPSLHRPQEVSAALGMVSGRHWGCVYRCGLHKAIWPRGQGRTKSQPTLC